MSPLDPNSYIIQWSEQDHNFHIEQSLSALSSTVQDFLHGGTHDGYVTVGIVSTHDEAEQLSHELARQRGLVWDESGVFAKLRV